MEALPRGIEQLSAMPNKVLVLADGDDPNQPALRRALQCVDDAGEIEVFGAVYEPLLEGYLGNQQIYEPLRKRVLSERRELVAALARAAESWGVRASGNAVWAHPPLVGAINEEIAARGIDLVVVAPAQLHSAGKGGSAGLSHGDWQLVAACAAPTLVVKSDGQAKYRRIVAAVDPFHTHAKPVGLDAEILRLALGMQAHHGAALTVLHCYTPVEYFGADLGPLPTHEAALTAAREEALHALCLEAGVPIAATKLVAGVPHTVLQGLQRSGEADLIVMGGLARGRLAEFLLGSTAERVLHHGHGDVLVVKPPKAAGTR
jgi:universal stress protein E